MKILKWDVDVDNRDHAIGAGRVVHVACQFGPYSVQVWTVEHDHIAMRQARVVGTGQEIPSGAEVLGTAVTTFGLVWHVIETKAASDD